MNRTFYPALILFLLLGHTLMAQEIITQSWGGGADLKDISFGFSFSSVNSYYKIDKVPSWQSPFLDPANGNQPVTSNLTGISSGYTPGFAVGFLARYRLTEYLEARITPSLIFTDKTLTYSYATGPDITKTVSGTSADIPLLLKLKSERIGDFRAYIIGGIKYSQAIGSNNSDINAAPLDKLVKNVSGYGSYEAGLGCDLYFEYFKMSPEIKISNSFGNVLYHNNTPFANPISALRMHTLMFTIYFE